MDTCPDCGLCNFSWSVPTERDPEIILTCEECGATWSEPNEKYIEAQKRDLEDDYYGRF
jgi:uncharacterized Zn finger protein